MANDLKWCMTRSTLCFDTSNNRLSKNRYSQSTYRCGCFYRFHFPKQPFSFPIPLTVSCNPAHVTWVTFILDIQCLKRSCTNKTQSSTKFQGIINVVWESENTLSRQCSLSFRSLQASGPSVRKSLLTHVKQINVPMVHCDQSTIDAPFPLHADLFWRRGVANLSSLELHTMLNCQHQPP